MKASDAYYVNSWRRRIEENGARNYPREAESCVDSCRLRLLVAINPNGTIHELRVRSEEHTSELQSRPHLVCRLLLEKKKKHKPLAGVRHPLDPPLLPRPGGPRR